MKRLVAGTRAAFKVLATTERSQGASMVLAAGASTGGPTNRHASDQWLFVVSGEGRAVVAGKKRKLVPGLCLLIEAGEAHEIRASRIGPLRTLNIYAPAAYRADGEELAHPTQTVPARRRSRGR